MRRGVWFGAGVAAGVYGMVKVRRVAEAFTPDGMRDRLSAVGLGARMFRDEVAQRTADAEPALREQLGLPPQGAPWPQVGAAARPELPPSNTSNERNEKDQR